MYSSIQEHFPIYVEEDANPLDLGQNLEKFSYNAVTPKILRNPVNEKNSFVPFEEVIQIRMCTVEFEFFTLTLVDSEVTHNFCPENWLWVIRESNITPFTGFAEKFET